MGAAISQNGRFGPGFRFPGGGGCIQSTIGLFSAQGLERIPKVITYSAGSSGTTSVTLQFAEHDDGSDTRNGYIKITLAPSEGQYTTIGDSGEAAYYEVDVSAPLSGGPPHRNCGGHGRSRQNASTGDWSCSCDRGWAAGTGCSMCAAGWAGTNCTRCADHFTGTNCATCTGHYTGAGCDVCSSGWATSSGCSICNETRFGPDCQTPCSCSHGTCDSGVAGTGHCTLCNSSWAGTDCDDCDDTHYGAACEKQCPDCKRYEMVCMSGKSGGTWVPGPPPPPPPPSSTPITVAISVGVMVGLALLVVVALRLTGRSIVVVATSQGAPSERDDDRLLVPAVNAATYE